jgi:hypothetical protein
MTAQLTIVRAHRRPEHAHACRETPCRKRDRLRARRIDPLQVIDRDQHRIRFRQCFDDGEKRCPYRSLLNDLVVGFCSQQEPVKCDSLRAREIVEHWRVHSRQQVGQGLVAIH